MDPFTPFLLERGLAGAIGKGPRSSEVRKAFLDQQAIYLVAVGGAAAYLGSRVREVELVAYEDLGAEAIYRLVLEDFPVLVAYDLKGGDLFERGVGVK
jgi:fumarate hydratase subunit beta